MGNPFVHCELMSTDVGKAKEFFGKLFDWQLDDMPVGDMPYTMIRVGEGTGGGLMKNPIPGAPSTMTGRGLHFTAAGLLADVWQWKATSGGPTGWMDDDHFGPPREPTPMQASSAAPYRGGFAPDPGVALEALFGAPKP